MKRVENFKLYWFQKKDNKELTKKEKMWETFLGCLANVRPLFLYFIMDPDTRFGLLLLRSGIHEIVEQDPRKQEQKYYQTEIR